MKRVLVTGARGFVGRRLVELGGRAPDMAWTGIDREEGDLCDERVADRLIREFAPDLVVHLAGIIGQPSDEEGRVRLRAVNAGGTRNILESLDRQALRTGTRPVLVLASTGLVYGAQPGPWSEVLPTMATDPYSRSKLEAESYLAQVVSRGHVGGVALRPALLYGPGQTGSMFLPSLARALAEGSVFPMTPGAQRRDFLHVDDFSAAVLAVLARTDLLASDPSQPPWIANVGTGVGTRLLDVAEAALAFGREMWPDCGRIDPGAVPYRPDESWDYRLSSGRLAAATGWSPTIPLEDGIRQCLLEARRLASTRGGSA